MQLRNNFEYLISIIESMTGEDIAPNTFLNISQAVEKIVTISKWWLWHTLQLGYYNV